MTVSTERQASILQLLQNLKGLEPLKKLFWSELNYERVNQPLSRVGWTDTAAGALAEDPILFAGGGQNNDFKVIYSHLNSEDLLITQERPVVTKLLRDHPYSLFVFSNKTQNKWHFINVKYDAESEKRRLFRRITIGPEERLRTASERISMLDLQSIQPDMFGLSSLSIQTKQDEAFDVEAVTDKFFEAYKEIFESVEPLISGITSSDAKRLFTQKLFNRLMFISFIQKKGWLKFGGQTDYLSILWSDYLKKKTDDANFYRDRLKILFFAGLNTSSNINIVDITHQGFIQKLIGDVPYLNGGLFEAERDDLDSTIVVPDQCFKSILEKLFGVFNFTIMESTPLDVEVAVDPEMLGKIFERLVTGRHETGSYYTPKTVVSFMCREALKAYLGDYSALIDKHDLSDISIPDARSILNKLSRAKICDPACGSGAYLVGMLHELHTLMRMLDTKSSQTDARDDYHLKLDIIQNNLYGVDLDSFAINIARLRLWLTLAVEFDGPKPEPLPNLDYKIEVGDSLTAPDPNRGSQQAIVGEYAKKFQEKTNNYMRTHLYGEKAALRKEADEIQTRIAEWIHAGARVSGFDWAVQYAGVFANGGFDIILANPPYGIKCEDPLRFQYFPRVKAEEPQSKDSYGLFIARGLQLLKEKGILTYIVSDTWRTIRSHRPLRKKLVNQTQMMHVIDLPAWIFDATVNTCIVSTIKQTPLETAQLVAGDLRNLPKGDWKTLEQNLTTISVHGPDCSTLTYARYTYMQSLISRYDNYTFFIGSPQIYKFMSDSRFFKLGQIADVIHGLTTGNTKGFIFKNQTGQGNYKLADSRLITDPLTDYSKLTDDERKNGFVSTKLNGRFLVAYDKGGASDSDEGWLPNYWVPTEYYIDWRRDSVESMKRLPGFRHDGKNYYFRQGITFSHTGVYSPTFRVNSGGIFDTAGSCIFTDKLDNLVLLGILNSLLTRYLFKNYINHTVNTAEDPIKELRIVNCDSVNSKLLRDKVELIIREQKANPKYPYHLKEQIEIDTIIFKLFGLTEEGIREVELWYCRRYSKLAEAQGVIDKVKEKYDSHLRRCDIILTKDSEYWKSNPVLNLIGQGESEHIEFKESLEADVKTGLSHPGIIIASLKTIAAFLNTKGGILLIGVSDAGELAGLEKDYRLCTKHDKDGFEQKVRSLIMSRFMPKPTGKIKISFEQIDNKEVCIIQVEKSKEITHLDNKDVFIREGNTSYKMEGAALTAWIKGKI